MPSKRLPTLDCLRGLAALAVAWYHFTIGGGLLHSGWLYCSGQPGWVAVEVFFVISGFIIPYSLYHAAYRPAQFGRFFLKRIARLDPPYFANIAFCLILSYLVTLAPGFRGETPHYTWGQLAAHVAYVNSFAHLRWINVVFWTLGIEFQYYLLIGLVFPLVATRRRALRIAFLAFLLALSVAVPDEALLFHYLPYFAAGIVAFQSMVGLISLTELALTLAATAIAGPLAAVGIVTALLIRFVHMRRSRLTDFGLISYSFYLLHVPIGGKIVNLGGRFVHGTPAIACLLLTALAVSVIAAKIFYRWVELPSQRWSSSIAWRGRERGSLTDLASAPAVRQHS